MCAGLEMVNHTHCRSREQDENGQSYSFTHQGTFRSFRQCIQLGFRSKTSLRPLQSCLINSCVAAAISPTKPTDVAPPTPKKKKKKIVK